VQKKYNLREGEIASFDVIAPYDFSIPKTDEERAEEREEIARRVLPVFDFNNAIVKNVSKRINDLERMIDSALTSKRVQRDSVLQAIGREYGLGSNTVAYLLKNKHKQILQKLKTQLSDLYASGIVESKPTEFRIITIVSGDKEMVESIDQVYSIAEAESIMSSGQRREYTQLAQTFIEPNVEFNREKTEARIEEVFANVPKTKGKVLKGEIIVEKHKRVTSAEMEKITALQQTYVSIGTWEIIKTIIFRNLLYLSIIFLLLRFDKITKAHIFELKNLYFIALLSGIYLIFGRITYLTDTIYLLPIAFFIFLFALYFNFYTALIFTIVFASILGITLNSLSIFTYLSVSGFVAAFSIQTINSRLSLYRPLLYITVANIAAIFFIDVYLLKGQLNFIHFGEGIMNGILANVLFALLLPVFEKLFDFTTDLTLLELGNLNLPLFKEMAIDAPGTYHHSIVVGNLAEAGARVIGADPILARVGSYYHDIGKLKKPEYFIENQIGVKNPHDDLKPQMSALIIISHVKDGLDMAKKMKLPRKVIDIIEQHHGTTTIESIYRKALHMSNDIDQDAFRYPGPIPQTKEAALVMLADSVEAAARSEKNITVTKLQKLLKDNVDRKFSDGQLDHCPINRQDLEQIKIAFLPVLTGIFHPRVEYDTETAPSGSPKASRPKNRQS
jgi:hypothetical protein